MISQYYEYFNGVCDCCGKRLGAERDDATAKEAMVAEGWHKVGGLDCCPLCWQRYQETGELTRINIFSRRETIMAKKNHAEEPEVIETAAEEETTGACADACPVETDGPAPEETGAEDGSSDAAPQDDAEAQEEDDGETKTNLVQDVIRAIKGQIERDMAANGESYHSAFESFGILNRAIEDKNAVEKDLKRHLGDLWDGVKREDDDVCAAYFSDIERVARESAMAWVRVAAIAEKAVISL